MTYPRSEMVEPGQPGYYHFVGHCPGLLWINIQDKVPMPQFDRIRKPSFHQVGKILDQSWEIS